MCDAGARVPVLNIRFSTIAATDPMQIPDPRNVCAHDGIWANSVGEVAGSSAKASGMATTKMFDELNRIGESVLTPDAATIPNSAIPAPPSTGAGIAATTDAVFGIKPSTISIPPATDVTHRERTLVIDSTPIFCANAVYWNVLKTPPSTVAAPSARRPSAILLSSMRDSVISPMATMSPVASTMVTRDTMHMAPIADGINSGVPK